MKNEDKAQEICMNIQPPYIDFIYQNYKTAMEMAEWKDKQFAEEKKQWIEKVCNFLENRNVLEKDCSILASGICNITFHPDNLINDLKQVMEEQQ